MFLPVCLSRYPIMMIPINCVPFTVPGASARKAPKLVKPRGTTPFAGSFRLERRFDNGCGHGQALVRIGRHDLQAPIEVLQVHMPALESVNDTKTVTFVREDPDKYLYGVLKFALDTNLPVPVCQLLTLAGIPIGGAPQPLPKMLHRFKATEAQQEQIRLFTGLLVGENHKRAPFINHAESSVLDDIAAQLQLK